MRWNPGGWRLMTRWQWGKRSKRLGSHSLTFLQTALLVTLLVVCVNLVTILPSRDHVVLFGDGNRKCIFHLLVGFKLQSSKPNNNWVSQSSPLVFLHTKLRLHLFFCHLYTYIYIYTVWTKVLSRVMKSLQVDPRKVVEKTKEKKKKRKVFSFWLFTHHEASNVYNVLWQQFT